MADYVINVVARDRVGIVAGVTRAIAELGGRVEAVSQTVLRGYFTLILTGIFPDTVSEENVQYALENTGQTDELSVSVRRRDAAAETATAGTGEQFVLTILGKSEAGVVGRITSYLASRDINIVDLYCYTEKGQFVMVSQVTVPERVDVRQVQMDLESLPVDHGLEIRLQHQNIFVATNEIEFRHRRSPPESNPC